MKTASEKIWTRNKDGSYTVSGAVATRKVRLSIVNPKRTYRLPCPVVLRTYAEQIIEEAIRKNLARADSYRLEEVTNTLDEESKQRLAKLREKKKSELLRQPASIRGARPGTLPGRVTP